MEDQSDAADDRDPKKRKVACVLQRVRDRALRNPPDFLELSGGHKAARKSQVAKNDLGNDRRRAKSRKLFDTLL